MNQLFSSARARQMAGVFLFAASASWAGGWNLPYAQLPKYDYKQYYHTSMITTIKALPNYLKESMSKGWTYYKGHYIMSNGLVNHMRKDQSGKVIGENEAVSEGQGYGMILAALNNDQTTFNKIFEAANQNMWDNGHKSYFKWQWPSNPNPGAATDADLDICAALIFADMLQMRKLWASYDKSGITYKSRAMDVMRSIRNNMTSNNYLLPGDNWGGSAINNLNPSYFATGYMKMFDEYQKELSFKPIIDKCYDVLKLRSNQYGKGQAPDWITSSGGSSGKGLGMTVEAIRCPWRIATDALWYNDPRAIEFCKNSKNTLSKYADANKNMVLAQMAQYDENTNIIASTAGLMKEIAMWECSVLGSKDTAFARGCLSASAFGYIFSNGGSCFGSTQLSDHQFYYNQSLGAMGFALISGQFPNIYSDLKDSVPKVAAACFVSSGESELIRIRAGSEGISVTFPDRSAGRACVGIYDSRGKLLFSRAMESDGARFIPLRNRGTGMYLLKFSSRGADGAVVERSHRFFWN